MVTVTLTGTGDSIEEALASITAKFATPKPLAAAAKGPAEKVEKAAKPTTTPAVTPAPVSIAKAPDVPPEPLYTIDSVKQLIAKGVGVIGKAAVVALLAKYGVLKGSELLIAAYPKFTGDLDQLIAKGTTQGTHFVGEGPHA